MVKYSIEVSKEAKEHLSYHYKSGHSSTIKRLERIFLELEENPALGIGQPEKLGHQYAGLWSRRINQKDRLIYIIDDELVTVYIVTAKGHYNDKSKA